MNQAERRTYLIKYLLNEKEEYKGIDIPKDSMQQKQLLRSLMNVRMPEEIDHTFIEVQDAYLKESIQEKGITDIKDLTPVIDNIYIWQGDITTLKCDAIVNAANSGMTGCYVPCHNCIDNCIHTYAGVQLRAECQKYMNRTLSKNGMDYDQPTAVPVLTDAYNLPAKKIIHVVGPIVQGNLTRALEKDLADCYRNTLDMCAQNELKSVAFCCISTGVFMFPNQRAAEIAVETVTKYLKETGSRIKVIFNVFKDIDLMFYQYYLGELEAE